MNLHVVTATTNPERAAKWIQSWGPVPLTIVRNGTPAPIPDPLFWRPPTVPPVEWVYPDAPQYLGSVSAFRLGVDHVLATHPEADIIACLHDDLELLEDWPSWQARVVRHFERTPACGLAGFGGAIGVGDQDIYQTPYRPEQLARIGFRSNLVDAEVHGGRSLLPERVACLDGFSQIGRRAFFEGWKREGQTDLHTPREVLQTAPWTYLEGLGIKHHLYDTALGLLAVRQGWETWYLPIRCHHHGGQTAVGDQGYARWATETYGGDHAIWEQAHHAGYEAFRDVLPLRI